MKRKSNTNTLYFQDKTQLVFVMLPYGYFYKGKYYTVAGCFKALEKDGEVETHEYNGGTWQWDNGKGNGIQFYQSLKELYEWNEDKIAMSFGTFRRKYSEYGVYHNPMPCTLYTYDKDEFCELFDTKETVINELRFYVSNYKFLADTEEYEEEYVDTLSKEECIAYFKKPIKVRIEILNNWEKD